MISVAAALAELKRSNHMDAIFCHQGVDHEYFTPGSNFVLKLKSPIIVTYLFGAMAESKISTASVNVTVAATTVSPPFLNYGIK